MASDQANPPKPAGISAPAFFNRFTDAERVAVQTAVNASPQLGVGLINGLAAGQIKLTDPVVKTWLDGLVTAGALTSAPDTGILTPCAANSPCNQPRPTRPRL